MSHTPEISGERIGSRLAEQYDVTPAGLTRLPLGLDHDAAYRSMNPGPDAFTPRECGNRAGSCRCGP